MKRTMHRMIHFFQFLCVILIFILTESVAAQVSDNLAPYGSQLSGSNAAWYDPDINTYVFRYIGDDETIRYRIDMDDPSVQLGLIKICEDQNIFDQEWLCPVAWAGTMYRKLDNEILHPFQLASEAQVTLISESFDGDKLVLKYRDEYGGVVNEKTFEFWIMGKTMVIHVYSSTGNNDAPGNYAGFLFDRSFQTPNPVEIQIPYVYNAPIVMVSNDVFYSTYLDMALSHSTGFVKQGCSEHSSDSFYCSHYSEYEEDSAGKITPLDETVYVTVSHDILDLMPKPSQEKSPYRDMLNNRVVLDHWFDFYYAKLFITDLFRFGLTDILVMEHFWQHHGYDQGMPLHYPAGEEYGGHEAFRDLAETAIDQGYLFAAHEDYWFMDSNTSYPYYNENNIAKNPDMTFRLGWKDPGTQQQHHAIASDKMIYYARMESPQIKAGYGTNAVYLDVNTAVDPESILHQIDFDASNPNSKNIASVIKNNKELFAYLQSVYEGPLLGEGRGMDDGFDSYYGGYVDGVERQIEYGYAAKVIPDFELRIVKPLMANQGMGYSHTYFLKGRAHIPDKEELDSYRATEIAYGHAGLIGNKNFWVPGGYPYAVKEYYLLQQLQSQYLSSDVSGILYRSGEDMVDLSQAIREGVDFVNVQLYEEYDNGLKLYVNRHQTENWLVVADGKQYSLPPNGWVAWNPGNSFLEYSAIVDGHRVDYVNSNSYVFADGRGAYTNFGNIQATNIEVRKADGLNISCNITDCVVLTFKEYHPADTNQDGCIDLNELAAYFDLWKIDTVEMAELMIAIGLWKQGC